MTILSETDQIIAHRYQISHRLGEGSSAITYQAQDLETGEKVAIKVLSLRHLDNWQKVELFAKEAKILQQLDHPHIPKYLDYFESAQSEEQNFYLVEELASGKSLATLVQEGWLPDEETVKKIAIQLLEILIYLQGLIPSVIHRDIKPQNIIYNNGEIFLVDFGTVQETYRNTITASIAVGTPDYMAPEQMGGKTNLSTDLYGLGMTLLFLLTGKSPLELPQKKLKIDFRQEVKISQNFADWLDKIIEPKSGDRLPNAQIAYNVLQNPKTIKNYLNWRQQCADYTLVNLSKTNEQLLITIPSLFWRNHYNRLLAFGVISWYVISFFITWVLFMIHPIISFFYVMIFLSTIKNLKLGFFTSCLGLLVGNFLVLYLVYLVITTLGKIRNYPNDYPYYSYNQEGIRTIIILSILILIIQAIWGKKIYSLLLEIITTIRLEITKQEFCLRRKIFNKWFIFLKKEVENLPKISEIAGMLTETEKVWLNKEIENFLAEKN